MNSEILVVKAARLTEWSHMTSMFLLAGWAWMQERGGHPTNGPEIEMSFH